MAIKVEDISNIIKRQIKEYGKYVAEEETGEIVAVGDEIARIHGLRGAMASELLEFPRGVMGMVLNLEEDNVGAIIMGDVTIEDNVTCGAGSLVTRSVPRDAVVAGVPADESAKNLSSP